MLDVWAFILSSSWLCMMKLGSLVAILKSVLNGSDMFILESHSVNTSNHSVKFHSRHVDFVGVTSRRHAVVVFRQRVRRPSHDEQPGHELQEYLSNPRRHLVRGWRSGEGNGNCVQVSCNILCGVVSACVL